MTVMGASMEDLGASTIDEVLKSVEENAIFLMNFQSFADGDPRKRVTAST